jgi:tetratricopeptide (TPR) repeat protein
MIDDTSYMSGHLSGPAHSGAGHTYTTPLIGRAKELGALTDMLAGCATGAGQMATIGGHAGVGKTRLAAELRAHSNHHHGDAVTWLWGGADAHAPRGLQALRQALNGRLSQLGIHPEELGRCELNGALAKALLEETELARDEIGDITDTLARLLIGADDTEVSRTPSEAQQARGAVLHALHALFLGMAWKRPTVLVIDDYHWADTPTAQLAWRLADVAADAPLFLVALYRPPMEGERGGLLSAGGGLASRYTPIYLEDLDCANAVELARSLTRIDPISEALASAVLYRCGGNPLFIEEALRPILDGAMTEERLLKAPVPETIQDAVVRRIDTLPPEAREALEIASIIGPQFSAELLWAVSSDPTRVGSALGELRRRQLVVEHVSRTRKLFAFRHVLLQEAVYSSVPTERRTRVHLKVADALEEGSERDVAERIGEIGLHYAAADVRAKAVDYLVAAGNRDRSSYLNDTAIEHYERALDVLMRDDEASQDAERVLNLTVTLGYVRARLGDNGKAEQRFLEGISLARRLGKDAEYIGMLHARLAYAQHWQQRKDEAGETAREGLRLVGEPHASPARVALLAGLCTSLQMLPSKAERLAATRQLEDALADVPYYEGIDYAYYCVAHDYMHRARRDASLWSHAIRFLMTMEAVCRKHGDGKGLARSIHGMADLYVERERKDERKLAIELYERSLEQAIYLSDTQMTFEGHMNLAHMIMLSGEPLPDAERHLRAGIVAMGRLQSATGYVAQAPEYFEIIGDEYVRRGLYEKAVELWIRSMDSGATAFLHRRLFMKLEGRLIDDGRHDEFPAMCEELRHYIEATPRASLRRPYLTPTDVSLAYPRHDPSVGLPTTVSGTWEWRDPMHGSQWRWDRGAGLVMNAPMKVVGRTEPPECPHLLRRIDGPFAAEAVVTAVDRAAGGLLLWAADDEYALVGKWFMGLDDMRTVVRLRDDPATVGRGMLPKAEPLHLRLEFDGARIRTLCSRDGHEWLLSGEEPFTPSAPVHVGVYADGHYDWHWVVTRFSEFRLYRP